MSLREFVNWFWFFKIELTFFDLRLFSFLKLMYIVLNELEKVVSLGKYDLGSFHQMDVTYLSG